MNETSVQLVLLDRDGVINFDSPDYIKHPDEWHPIPGAIQAIVTLQQHDVRVAVCTNQAGIGRGLLDETTLAAIHDKLNAQITTHGGTPVDIFYCPHHPDDGCPCRKPKPALLLQAMRAYDISAQRTIYAGDSEKDLLAAASAACRSVLVLTGNGGATARSDAARQADLQCASLQDLPSAMSLA